MKSGRMFQGNTRRLGWLLLSSLLVAAPGAHAQDADDAELDPRFEPLLEAIRRNYDALSPYEFRITLHIETPDGERTTLTDRHVVVRGQEFFCRVENAEDRRTTKIIFFDGYACFRSEPRLRHYFVEGRENFPDFGVIDPADFGGADPGRDLRNWLASHRLEQVLPVTGVPNQTVYYISVTPPVGQSATSIFYRLYADDQQAGLPIRLEHFYDGKIGVRSDMTYRRTEEGRLFPSRIVTTYCKGNLDEWRQRAVEEFTDFVSGDAVNLSVLRPPDRPESALVVTKLGVAPSDVRSGTRSFFFAIAACAILACLYWMYRRTSKD